MCRASSRPRPSRSSMARALCMLLPSRREGYGLVVIEAASRGTPSVVVAGARQRGRRAGRRRRQRACGCVGLAGGPGGGDRAGQRCRRARCAARRRTGSLPMLRRLSVAELAGGGGEELPGLTRATSSTLVASRLTPGIALSARLAAQSDSARRAASVPGQRQRQHVHPPGLDNREAVARQQRASRSAAVVDAVVLVRAVVVQSRSAERSPPGTRSDWGACRRRTSRRAPAPVGSPRGSHRGPRRARARRSSGRRRTSRLRTAAGADPGLGRPTGAGSARAERRPARARAVVK